MQACHLVIIFLSYLKETLRKTCLFLLLGVLHCHKAGCHGDATL